VGEESQSLTSRPIRISLQAKILAAVVLCLLAPLVVMGVYLLRHNEAILGEKIQETLSNQLFRKASQLDEWMNERLREASRWSASFIVFEGVESLSRPGADVQRTRVDLRDYLESVLGHYPVYESLFITDLQGNVLSATSTEELEPWARELLKAIPAGRSTIVSPLRRSERLERPTLLVLRVIQGRGDHPIGYFGERLDLRELAVFLSDSSPEPGPTFWLLDEEGRVLLKGGVILTMDARLGDFEKGDVLIEGSKIAAVGPNLQASATIVDASSMIVMPVTPTARSKVVGWPGRVASSL